MHRLTTAGVIVEVPSAALLAGPILARTAFARICTNDRTQYVMAADRLLADLAVLSSSRAPAVLQLVAATCRAGALGSRPVGVCGEPALAMVLVGLGASTVSMTTRALPDVATALASATFSDCGRLAQVGLGTESADGARSLVRGQLAVLDELGL